MTKKQTPTSSYDQLIKRLRDGNRVADERTRREMREASYVIEKLQLELQMRGDALKDIRKMIDQPPAT